LVKRIVLEVVLIVALTILLAWAMLGAFALTDSADPVGTVVDQTPRVLFGLLGIALGLWTLLLIIGSIVHRRRAAGWRVATHLVSLLVALVVNVGGLALLTVATGGGADGWGMLVVGIGVASGAVLLGAGLVVVLVVELLILPAAAPLPPVAPAAPTALEASSEPGTPAG
jgi:hypothetical protein